MNGKIIEEFVGLRAKMYPLKTKKEEMRSEEERSQKYNSHQDYVDCLFEERKFMHTMHTIRSFKHQHYTIKQNRISLSLYNDKRYLMDDGVSSLPYDYFSLLQLFRKFVNYFFRNLCNVFYFLRNLKQK